ncbi:hypothetical protein IV203_017043 [Nitzschia inconspicua]|uniref:Uncharacterized protein n=1 Tax=Nitzschia inconspicua TaxID=303405 RepID=A0A9K3KQY8_9STRA|nr:hypothetical protein IV203_017043 [Nitzschia inconspicua]
MATPTPTAVDNVPPSAESADTFQSAEQHELEPTVAYEATPIQMRQLFPNPHLPILPLYLRHFVDSTTSPSPSMMSRRKMRMKGSMVWMTIQWRMRLKRVY